MTSSRARGTRTADARVRSLPVHTESHKCTFGDIGLRRLDGATEVATEERTAVTIRSCCLLHATVLQQQHEHHAGSNSTKNGHLHPPDERVLRAFLLFELRPYHVGMGLNEMHGLSGFECQFFGKHVSEGHHWYSERADRLISCRTERPFFNGRQTRAATHRVDARAGSEADVKPLPAG